MALNVSAGTARFRQKSGHSGKHILVASLSQADPNRSFTLAGAPGILTVCGRLKEEASWGASPVQIRGPHDEVPSFHIRSQTMLATYDAVAALTDTFCCDKLNNEYRDLARAMTAALCRKRPSPLASGQRRTWALSIIYVLGQINFLSDKATQPYMAMADVCAAFQRRSEHGERQGSGHFGRTAWTRPGCCRAWLTRTRWLDGGSQRRSSRLTRHAARATGDCL
jgi:Domain of unknown function (DUF6398)